MHIDKNTNCSRKSELHSRIFEILQAEANHHKYYQRLGGKLVSQDENEKQLVPELIIHHYDIGVLSTSFGLVKSTAQSHVVCRIIKMRP